MGKLAKALSEDIDVASLRLRLNRALRTLHEDKPSRKRELHVSDFTDNDKVWCYRALMMRYYYRKDELRNVTWVQYDGKSREDKWRRLLEAEGMLVDYQKALKLGPLSGHPDFIVRLTPKGKTVHVVELTGHNRNIDFKLLAIRTAKKKRQCRLYTIMLAHEMGREGVGTGYVVVEDKGSNEFKILPCPWEEEEMRPLLERVVRAKALVAQLDRVDEDGRLAAVREVEGCGRARCTACNPKEEQ